MVMALDWDGTLGAMPPTLRDGLVALLVDHGVRPVIITNRANSWPITEAPAGVAVVYCAGRPKRQVAREAGLAVLWWLDDMPVLVDFGEAGLGMVTP